MQLSATDAHVKLRNVNGAHRFVQLPSNDSLIPIPAQSTESVTMRSHDTSEYKTNTYCLAGNCKNWLFCYFRIHYWRTIQINILVSYWILKSIHSHLFIFAAKVGTYTFEDFFSSQHPSSVQILGVVEALPNRFKISSFNH